MPPNFIFGLAAEKKVKDLALILNQINIGEY